MRDVAEHAGVSAQTVSNLVNNRLRQMSDETRLRIEGAMEQLGYHPNLTARSLRSARTTTIGFLLLDEGARYLADPMTDQVIAGVGARLKSIPDLKWEIKDIVVAGNQVTVRGEATGTPAGEFMGAPHTGKSFKLMSIDVHTLEAGKMVRSYHIEDWIGAVRQLTAK